MSEPAAQLAATLSREVALACDGQGTIAWADERAERMIGARPGRPLREVVADGSEEKASRLVEEACQRQVDGWELIVVVDCKPAMFTFSGAPHPGGAVLVGSLVSEPYRQALDRLSVAMGEIADLHRQAHEALRAREAERDRLQQVIDVLPEAVLIVDADRRIALSNAAAVALLGMLLAGRRVPFDDVDLAAAYAVRRLDGAPLPAPEWPLHRSLALGETVRGEQLLVRNAADARDVPLLVNSAPLHDRYDELIGAVAVFQDITAIKDLERQKDDFLSSTAHDLRNPLTSIKGYAEFLRRLLARSGPPEVERIAAGLAQIEAAAARMSALIDQVTDLAHQQMGRPLELRRQPTDLVALVREVAAQHQQTSARHTIRVEAGVERLVGDWDLTRLERVVQNLCGNAIKYSPDGGEVVLRVARERDDAGWWAVLTVSDRGLGIPPADLPLVFDRFYRASNVVGRLAGTGIGLASARQTVEQHGGSITVESELGRGSTFMVRLPLG